MGKPGWPIGGGGSPDGVQWCGVAPTRAMTGADIDPLVFVALDVGHTVGADGELTPTVVIDVEGYPQIADLARVHAVDGVGDVTTAAVRSDTTIIIGVRLSRPVLAAFAIFQFLWVWNDLLVALTFAGGTPDVAPITAYLANIKGTYGAQLDLITAGAFIAIIVPLIVFFALQRFFVRGLLAGSVKG